MIFTLPPGVTAEQARELERACVAGGPDNMPWPTEVRVDPTRLICRRDVDESGMLVVPWDIPGVGRVMGATATLIEQDRPYQFLTELARGKVNQLRTQVADWQIQNLLQLPAHLGEEIHQSSVQFSRAVTQGSSAADSLSQAVLEFSYRSADDLVRHYVEQVLQSRHKSQQRLDALLGCTLGGGDLPTAQRAALLPCVNSVALNLSWNELEPAESSYSWGPSDKLLEWALANGLTATGGPLIDFSAARLPDWLWLWDRDLSSIASFACSYVETVLKRYAGRIRSWELCTASNSAGLLGLGEEEFMGLTARLLEAARQVDPKLELGIGIAQPWGEYMAVEDRTHSPLYFAETLIRYGLNLAFIELELVMGVHPRGSYCRGLLETSRLMDSYAQLGIPMRVALGYPSRKDADGQAVAELEVDAGHWGKGFHRETQAGWANVFTSLALSKSSLRAVRWIHAADSQPHQFPHCGLFDRRGNPKPVLQALRNLRESHLR
jgi:hypothetical protein